MADNTDKMLLRDVLYAYMLCFIVLGLFQVVLPDRPSNLEISLSGYWLEVFLTVAAPPLIAILFIITNYGSRFREFGFTLRPLKRNLLVGVLAFIVLSAVCFSLTYLIEDVLGQTLFDSHREVLSRPDKDLFYSIVFLDSVILVPLGMAIFNVGFIYTIVRSRFGFVLSVLLTSSISSLVFLLFDPFLVVVAFACSLILSVAFEYTRSLLPVVMANSMYGVGCYLARVF